MYLSPRKILSQFLHSLKLMFVIIFKTRALTKEFENIAFPILDDNAGFDFVDSKYEPEDST